MPKIENQFKTNGMVSLASLTNIVLFVYTPVLTKIFKINFLRPSEDYIKLNIQMLSAIFGLVTHKKKD